MDNSDMASTKPAKNILVGCTTCLAVKKLPQLLKLITEENFRINVNVSVITTARATLLYQASEFPPSVKLYYDKDEWSVERVTGDSVLHIELAKWADVMVIAPLSANTLAKMSQGLCDNLLTCTTRAWDMSKPLLFCPAMSTRMWRHPLTSSHIERLKEWGHTEVPCIEKTLDGDTGIGAMAELETIVKYIKNHLMLRYSTNYI